MGKYTGMSTKKITQGSQAVKESIGKLKPRSTIEKIRAVVHEELSTVNFSHDGVTRSELEERMKVMTDAVIALQEKLSKMAISGPISEKAFMDATQSIDTAGKLHEEEKAILTRIFRQNIAIQKPEMTNKTD